MNVDFKGANTNEQYVVGCVYFDSILILVVTKQTYYTPAPPKVEWGYTGFTPMSVRPSVRLYTRFPELSEKNYWLNSFHTWHLPLWGDSLDPYSLSCSLPHFWPLGGQIFDRKRGFRNFLKKLLANSFHTWNLPLWGESLDPYTRSCS